jgi:hypothetical protein
MYYKVETSPEEMEEEVSLSMARLLMMKISFIGMLELELSQWLTMDQIRTQVSSLLHFAMNLYLT